MTRDVHERIDDLLDGALAGTLDGEDRAALEAHVRKCGECARLAETLQSAAAAWKEQPDSELDEATREAVGDRVMGAIADIGRAPAARQERSRRFAIAVTAAAFAAAAAAALVIVWSRPTGGTAGQPGVARATEATSIREALGEPSTEAAPSRAVPNAVRVTASLGGAFLTRDGTKPVLIDAKTEIGVGDLLSLDGGASLELALPSIGDVVLEAGTVASIGEVGDLTVVELRRGAIACRVDPRGAGQEFRVDTPGGSVEVVGTVFRVEVAATATASVQVARGEVLVRDAADERNVVAVEAGQLMTFDWSKPTPTALGDEARDELLALFGLFAPDSVARASAANRRPRASEEAFERLFARAQELRRAGDVAGAIEVYDSIARQAPRRSARAEASFAIGQMKLNAGDPTGALTRFSSDEALLLGSPYGDMTLYYIAQCAHRLGRCDQARAAAKRFLERAPSHRLAKRAREIEALCAGE